MTNTTGWIGINANPQAKRIIQLGERASVSAGVKIAIAGRLQVISLENYYSVTGIELRIIAD